MSIGTIVVGVADLENDPVLPAAVVLAARVGATLHAVYGFELHHLVLRAHRVLGVTEPETRKRYQEKLGERLAEQLRRLAESEALHGRAVAQPAGDALAAVAAEVAADLVVVGSTRQRPMVAQILGSTADRVIRTATVPVLVLRPPFTTTLRRVLLTTDLSELSAGALARGAEVAAQLASPGPPEVRCLAAAWASEEAATPIAPEQLREQAGEELTRFLAPLQLPFADVRLLIRSGDPAREIVAEAAEWNADLVVVGSRGRLGVSRFLLGSVATSVLRSSACHVLVVPTPGSGP
jgi:nucleotide-binding universal stress UspA family protein